MSKRKMPPHIVLPNGQWRFVKRGSKSSKKTRSKRGGFMSRRKSGRRKGGMGGIMGLAMPFAIGAIAGAYSDKIPLVNSMPPIVAGAAGGFIARRNIKGAIAGAAGSYLASGYIKGMTGNGSSSAW